jgi:hypothetical protein
MEGTLHILAATQVSQGLEEQRQVTGADVAVAPTAPMLVHKTQVAGVLEDILAVAVVVVIQPGLLAVAEAVAAAAMVAQVVV